MPVATHNSRCRSRASNNGEADFVLDIQPLNVRSDNLPEMGARVAALHKYARDERSSAPYPHRPPGLPRRG
jgi:hypothetical protein